MLNFIICEDDVDFRKHIRTITENFMMSYDIDYHFYEFSGYTKKFESIAKSELGFKIYFLDIKTSCGTGMDAARMIREEIDDWSSVLIMVTSFGQYRYEALTSRLALFDFINKLDDCEKEIKSALGKALKNYNARYKALRYEYNHIFYRIEYRHIIYIEKEPDSKRCHIQTTDGEYTISGTLNEILKKLDNRFLKVHRSMIINVDQMKKYEVRENKITFKNGMTTYSIARDKKKELTKRG